MLYTTEQGKAFKGRAKKVKVVKNLGWLIRKIGKMWKKTLSLVEKVTITPLAKNEGLLEIQLNKEDKFIAKFADFSVLENFVKTRRNLKPVTLFYGTTIKRITINA